MVRSAGTILITAVVASLTATVTDARSLPGSPLEGRWAFTWTPSEVRSSRADPVLAGRYVVEFRGGTFIRLLPLPVARKARVAIRGDLATFVFTAGTTGLVAGRPYTMRWSIYRDRLTWAPAPGRDRLDLFVKVPWTRVR